jgi:hypothetical protein
MLPLYQGVMVHNFDFAAKAWPDNAAPSAQWQEVNWEAKRIVPKYLMARKDYVGNEGAVRGLKVAFRDVARTTDERSMIASVVPDMPCGNTLGVLTTERDSLLLLVCLCSLIMDTCVRVRMAGTHLNYFVIDELPLVRPDAGIACARLVDSVRSLACVHEVFAPHWLRVSRERPWRQLWAVTPYER